MATPEISIILPFYNAEKYFAECLESIITQTFKNIEILCINDGSTDNSLEILNAYVAKDARIRVFNQNNQGPAKARNIGLENAHGKYLMFCDADDTYEPTMCADMLNAIKTHNVDFVMCDVNLLEVDNNHGRSAGYFNYHRLHYKGITKLTEDLKSNINVLLWNKIFKIDIIKKYNMSFPNGYECDDDCFMWQYLSISHEFYGLDKKLYNYKILNNSIMGKIYAQKHIDKIADRIFAVRYFLHFLKNNDLLTNNSFFLDVVDKSIFWSLI